MRRDSDSVHMLRGTEDDGTRWVGDSDSRSQPGPLSHQQKPISSPPFAPAEQRMNEKRAICGRSACWEEQIVMEGKIKEGMQLWKIKKLSEKGEYEVWMRKKRGENFLWNGMLSPCTFRCI